MSNRPDDWYRHDARAFLEGVQGMGPELIGAYIVLLDLLYARNGNLPRDDRHLSGVMGCSVRKARALTDALIEAGKLRESEGRITNERAEIELERRRNERETSAKGGRTKAENEAARKENNDIASTKRREEKRVDTEANASVECAREAEVHHLPFAAPEPPPQSKPPPKAVLPEGWVMPDEFTDYARNQGLTDREIADEGFAFHAYFTDKREKRSERGWLASWQGWVRRAASSRHRQPRQQSGHRSGTADAFAAVAQRIASQRGGG